MPTPVEIDLSTSGLANITGVYEGNSFAIKLELFEDDGTTPINWTPVIKMDICRDSSGFDRVIELTEIDGIARAGNTLIISRNRHQNTLKAVSYYYSIQTNYEDGSSLPIMIGRFTVLPNPNR